MNTKFARLSLAVMLAVTLALAIGVVAASADGEPVSENGIEPVFVAGNPSCTDLGYDFGFKVDPPNSGTYSIDGINTVTVSTDGVYFDWSSTLGMDAVLAKGGPNANTYIYDPPTESFGDGGLASPINPNTGRPFGLSHIEFCYDYELTASKTANATYTRTFSWTIDKSVSPATHIGFTGDSFTSNYTVVVDQTVADSDFAVSGNIVVNNPTPFSVGFSVADSVGGTAATVDCDPNTSGNQSSGTLAPGASVTCTYSASFGNTNPGNGTNTATITSSNSNVGGATASANYTFGNPTTVVGYPTINVNDSVQGALGSASADKTFTYPRNFTCDANEGTHNNTATIVETGQSDSASVTITCYELTVTKDATTSFNRKWNWTIDKTGDQTQLTLSPGQQFLVNYTVVVTATPQDSAWGVSGNISVHNPAPIAATLNSVNDVVSPNIAASVNCNVTFPYTLAAGGTLPCTYSASLPDGTSRTNTATATLQNYSYSAEGVGTPSGTTDFSGSAAVTFGAPTSEQDECITIVDDKYGNIGTVCANDPTKTFTYSLYVGPYAECGTYTYVNTATFTTNDTGATGSNDHTVNIIVPCAGGCTLTPGYWKTHSEYGPAPYDDAWLNLGDADGDGVIEGQDETFFLSGKTYYQVLWTSPQGNAYYILAHAYIAAKLNIVNGASSTSAVDAAITFAESFFSTKTPASSLTKAQRNQVIANANTLDQYNNGLIGPGHCSE